MLILIYLRSLIPHITLFLDLFTDMFSDFWLFTETPILFYVKGICFEVWWGENGAFLETFVS